MKTIVALGLLALFAFSQVISDEPASDSSSSSSDKDSKDKDSKEKPKYGTIIGIDLGTSKHPNSYPSFLHA
jgi:hypothetical protein